MESTVYLILAGKDSFFSLFVCLFFMMREGRRRVCFSPTSNQISFHLQERVHPLQLEESHATPARLLLA